MAASSDAVKGLATPAGDRLVARQEPTQAQTNLSTEAMTEAIERLHTQRNSTEQLLQHELESQGWIGQNVDSVKTWLQPAQSSKRLQTNLALEGKQLDDLKKAADNNDTTEFNRIYQNLTGTKFQPGVPHRLRSFNELTEYKDSQHNWVDGTANGVAIVGGLLFTRRIIGTTAKTALSLTAGNALTTGLFKTSLKLSDGQYAHSLYDFSSGAASGTLAVASEAAGTAAAIRLARNYGLETTAAGALTTRIATEGHGLGVKYLSAFGRFGVPWGVYSASTPWTNETLNSLYYHRRFDWQNTAIYSGVGLATGLSGGTLLGFGMSKLPPALYGFFN